MKTKIYETSRNSNDNKTRNNYADNVPFGCRENAGKYNKDENHKSKIDLT